MKILCLRFSSIGDIVLTSPVVRALHEQIGAEVHFVTKKAFEPILTSNPHISRVFAFEKDIRVLVPQLRAERYDWVIDLHHNLRSQQLKMLLRRPSRSFDKLNIEKWLLVNTGINLLPHNHIVERYMAAAAHLGVHDDGKGLDFFIPENQKVTLSDLSPLLAPGKYIALVLGATHATKRMPPDKLASVIRLLGAPVVLLGGKAEAETGRWLSEQAGSSAVDTCGQLSLMQSASVVEQAGKVVTHDTGLMHIAAALGKDIVSVWGSTIPGFGMYPFLAEGKGSNVTIEVDGLSCRPCSKIGFARCPKGHFRCMNLLDEAAIARAASLHLGLKK